MTLLIMAAGLATRYGGLKQLEPVTKTGECLLDFSVHDAVLAGFDTIVLVVREEHLTQFRETIAARWSDLVDVVLVTQSNHALPDGFFASKRRVRPWGTAPAVLAARQVIQEPFAVVNADDFYGRTAFFHLAEHLRTAEEKQKNGSYCMVGYTLRNTLMDRGAVARAVCTVKNGRLVDITERKQITDMGRAAIYSENSRAFSISLDTVVSMNCWGFTPDVFDRLEQGFCDFLKKHSFDLQREYDLPAAVMEMISKDATVTVYSTEDQWCGITYRDDREETEARLRALKKQKIYPAKLNQIKRLLPTEPN